MWVWVPSFSSVSYPLEGFGLAFPPYFLIFRSVWTVLCCASPLFSTCVLIFHMCLHHRHLFSESEPSSFSFFCSFPFWVSFLALWNIYPPNVSDLYLLISLHLGCFSWVFLVVFFNLCCNHGEATSCNMSVCQKLDCYIKSEISHSSNLSIYKC